MGGGWRPILATAFRFPSWKHHRRPSSAPRKIRLGLLLWALYVDHCPLDTWAIMSIVGAMHMGGGRFKENHVITCAPPFPFCFLLWAHLLPYAFLLSRSLLLQRAPFLQFCKAYLQIGLQIIV